jgi:hypothetical protein
MLSTQNCAKYWDVIRPVVHQNCLYFLLQLAVQFVSQSTVRFYFHSFMKSCYISAVNAHKTAPGSADFASAVVIRNDLLLPANKLNILTTACHGCQRFQGRAYLSISAFAKNE